MKTIKLLVLFSFLLFSCEKDTVVSEEETFQVSNLTNNQLNRAWDFPSNDNALEQLLELTAQENVLLVSTWDRKGRDSRQGLVLIPKVITSRPLLDGEYEFYDADELVHLNGLFSGNWLAFIKDDGVTRSITGDGVYEIITVQKGKVYVYEQGTLIEYN